MICDDCEGTNLAQSSSVDPDVNSDDICVVGRQFGLLWGNFQRVNRSFSRQFTKEASSSSFLAKPSMLLAKRKLVIVLPSMLTVPL